MLKTGTISDVREYYLDRKDENIFLNALKEFFDLKKIEPGCRLETPPLVEGLFMEWIFYDFKLKNGYTILEDFYKTNPFSLLKNELSIYKDLQENYYGLWEVVENRFGEGLKLKNIQTGKKYFVSEFSGTLEVNIGDITTGRIGKVNDHYELVGSDGLLLPAEYAKDFAEEFKKINLPFTPKMAKILILDRNKNTFSEDD